MRRQRDSPVRWGIAATGGIATAMTTALGTLPDAEVVAVGSRSADGAARFATTHGIPRHHDSYEALFADDGVDIVYIATPHNRHCDMTIDALRAGRHVLCEKPLAVNAAQGRRMIGAARESGRFLMEAMWSWFMPAWWEARRRIDKGEIGDVRLVEGAFGIAVFDESSRLRRPELIGGALVDLGIYPLALARFVLGEPTGVVARADLTAAGVDATTAGVLTFDSGALAVFSCSIDGVSRHEGSIVGTKGSITLDARFWHPDGLTVQRLGKKPRHVERPNQGLAHEAAHCMERIRAGQLQSDVVTWDASLASLDLMDEIRRQIGVVYPEERDAAGAG